MVGLYGRQQAGRITQIGFITMDTTGAACVAPVEEKVEEKQDEEAEQGIGDKITELLDQAK